MAGYQIFLSYILYIIVYMCDKLNLHLSHIDLFKNVLYT